MPANIAHTPMIKRILKTADPTMVPTPTSLLAINTPAIITIALILIVKGV